MLIDITNNHLEDYVSNTEEQIRSDAKSYMIRYKKLTTIVYTEVFVVGMKLTIRHLSNARKRRGLNQLIWEAILDRFLTEPDFGLPVKPCVSIKNLIKIQIMLKSKQFYLGIG